MYRKFGIVLAILQLFTTACWDQLELNDRAIWMGSGIDRNENGDIVLSGQILIPGHQGGAGGGAGSDSSPGKTGYFVVSGKGKNVSQAAANFQGKLSRQVFPGHRRVIVLGEQFAKEGAADMLDEHFRNPEVRLRTDIFVVKGNTAGQLLQLEYPLEKVPSIGAFKELEHASGMKQMTFMRFLRAASSDGISPVLPVISIDETDDGKLGSTSKQTFQIDGLAIFDDENLRLKGFIRSEEAMNVNWITGMLSRTTVTALVPKPQGNVSLHLSRIGRKIQPEVKDGKLTFHVLLSGKGVIRENQTRLDLRDPVNVKLVKQTLESEAANTAEQIIAKMQNIYREDIFGFGEILHRKEPSEWKKWKSNWNDHFAEAEFDVRANLTISQIGLVGPGLHWREEETTP
ncbi:Ger(x)C family spore germination protein [Paenibacillus hodogayensis]|uniref:Ger(X)C family spore germination protein n=1 Tax=Paenibacillus hodogayensis TaxID=279208 RepID=A0ABV5VPG0_9BACL